ncbi:YbaB/EbfC family nucleoid-associated protein [Actinosynnema sp. NPDC059335]|uniref:YbaB/EbfC family nucleoid-associated protein n=1 Tax=Actinosynnema sp. NPDC059335 TaxID=3346804 RepID=UPI00366BC881
MNPERMIADLEARARELTERSRELRDRLRDAQATQRSPDGAVTATVAPNGSLRHIEFSSDAARFAPARLGEVVLDTVRRAQARAARQAAEAVGPRFGGTAAMDFLTGPVPPGPAGVAADVADAAGGPAADVAGAAASVPAVGVAADVPDMADAAAGVPAVADAAGVPAVADAAADVAGLPLPRSLREPDDEPGTARW